MILSTDPKPCCLKKRQNVLNKGYLQRQETVNGVLKLYIYKFLRVEKLSKAPLWCCLVPQAVYSHHLVRVGGLSLSSSLREECYL